jgi:hypothetical protein
MDWGLAKVLPGSGRSSRRTIDQTVDGQMVGTPEYMAPEQAYGKVSELDQRSDIYALGGILYSILTLRPPVTGTEAKEVLLRVVEGRIVSPAVYSDESTRAAARARRRASIPEETILLRHCPRYEIHPDLISTCEKAMALKPGARFRSAAALRDRIADCRAVFGAQMEEETVWKQAIASLTAVLEKSNRELADWEQKALVANREPSKPELPQISSADEVWSYIDHQISLVAARDAPARSMLDRARMHLARLDLEAAHQTFEKAAEMAPEDRGVRAAAHRGALAVATLKRRVQFDNPIEEVVVPESAENRVPALLGAVGGAQSIGAPGAPDDTAEQGLVTQVRAALARLMADNPGLVVSGRDVSVHDGGVHLSIAKAELKSVRELAGLPIRKLFLLGTGVEDLAPLAGMPLEKLELYKASKVTDLSPLQGAPLKALDLTYTAVVDLAPLRGMPLDTLFLDHTLIDDIQPLTGMPLKSLGLSHTRVSDLSPLRGMGLNSLSVSNTVVRDLSPLQGMPLEALGAFGTRVVDLAPLTGAPLRSLYLQDSPVHDLQPLMTMQLETLNLRNTRVREIAPLRGMKLETLLLDGCLLLKDVRVLTTCTALTTLSLPAQAEGVADLRRLPVLAFVNTGPERVRAIDFWRAFDAAKGAGR